MFSIFYNLPDMIKVFIAGIICFLFTSMGASLILLFKNIKKNTLDSINSIASGIMLSASIFSLLIPAIKVCSNIYLVLISFILGGVLIYFGNIITTKFEKKINSNVEWKRCLLLFTSITIHNIPEGLVVGVAFGGGNILAAVSLTIGIALQNFPEGAAISFPLKKQGLSSKKAALLGIASGIVEPIAAIVGYYLVTLVSSILPVILSLAAGVMIYVIIVELIPDSQNGEKKDLMALLSMIGFSFMVFMETILG